MRERRKKRDKGNDYFLGGETVGKESFTISQPIRKKTVYTIGKLGNGILRPPKTKLNLAKKPPKSIRQISITNSSSLNDSADTQKMVKQIEDSIQARIDKAKEAQDKAKTAATEEEQDKKPMNKTLKTGLMVAAFLVVIGGIAYLANKKNLKTKKA